MAPYNFQQHLIQCGPFLLEDVEADIAMRVDIWVEAGGGELHCWRLVGVACNKRLVKVALVEISNNQYNERASLCQSVSSDGRKLGKQYTCRKLKPQLVLQSLIDTLHWTLHSSLKGHFC